ncbi:MAG: hypothetical protein ACJ8CB_18465 [Ktedonobacteraceae bacterium]
MKLKPKPGGPEMTAALAHPYVHKIVDILMRVLGNTFFKDVASFLTTYYHATQLDFVEALDDLRTNFRVFPNENGLFTPPTDIDELIQTLEALYQQDEKLVGFQRGAIVELLTARLVSLRYRPRECLSNQCFVDRRGREITGQIDIAAFSDDKNRAEGYECKMKASGTFGLASEDCDNLRALVKAAQAEEYFVHVGVVSFDSKMFVKRKLKHFYAPSYIEAYGFESIGNLRYTPSYIKPEDNIENL